MPKLISIIVPIYNEEKNISLLYNELKKVLDKINYAHEIIFINDGSHDNSATELKKIQLIDDETKIIDFSRNFGKEIAITAGINNCSGDACIMIDADLQHPPELIYEFLAKWKHGAEIVIGVRNKNQNENFIKKTGSYCFYKIINKISDTKITPFATDYRLLDRIVIKEFNKFTEKNRITRGLIDWLGFRRDYIYFKANQRAHGKASYCYLKLFKLAINSIVSLSLFPLKIGGYSGIFITLSAGLLGIFIIIEKYIFNDPWNLNFSGPAILAVIILFLVGTILSCLGLMALYIASIHNETINRPLYVIRKQQN